MPRSAGRADVAVSSSFRGRPVPGRQVGCRVEYNAPAMRNLVFGVFVALCLLASIWPGYDWLGNRIEPYVLGLPFSFIWTLGAIVASFAGLLIYDLAERRAAARTLPAAGQPEHGAKSQGEG